MLSQFENFNILKKKYIYHYPTPFINHKLMVFDRKKSKIYHDKLKNFYKYFSKNDTIIINKSKAYPIKYKCYKNKNNQKSFIDIYLKKEINNRLKIWDVLVSPARKVRIGNKLFFKDVNNETILSEVLNNTTSKGRILKFSSKENNITFKKKLFPTGKFLLHPYTLYNKKLNINYYGNSYSRYVGSIIFPASGSYLDKTMFLKLKLKNINILKIIFHLNLMNIEKIKLFKRIKKNNLNSERLIIKQKYINKIKKIKHNSKICCIGANTLRAIENLIFKKYKLTAFNGYVDNNFYYPYEYKLVNSLLTYFNNPKSLNFLSLLNMCGVNNTYKIYNEALTNKYHFNIYGDLLLII